MLTMTDDGIFVQLLIIVFNDFNVTYSICLSNIKLKFVAPPRSFLIRLCHNPEI